MSTVIYGVRGSDPRNTVVKAEDRDTAKEMLLPGDMVVESHDGGRTWESSRCRAQADGSVRDYGSTTCDDCGTALILPGWLCPDCATDRGVR